MTFGCSCFIRSITASFASSRLDANLNLLRRFLTVSVNKMSIVTGNGDVSVKQG